jgi:hypothetical protein
LDRWVGERTHTVALTVVLGRWIANLFFSPFNSVCNL